MGRGANGTRHTGDSAGKVDGWKVVWYSAMSGEGEECIHRWQRLLDELK